MFRFTAFLVLLAALPAAAQTDGPFIWTAVDGDIKPLEVVFQDDGTLIAAADDLWRRAPGATAWETIDLPNLVRSGYTVLPLRGDTLIAGRFLSRSFDGGRTWDEPTCAEDGGDTITCDRLDVSHSRAIYEVAVGPYAGRLLAGGALYSDDRGASWQTATVTDWPQEFRMYAFAALPSGRVLGAGDFGAGVSTGGGATWAATELYLPYGYSGFAVEPWATPGSVQAHAAGGPAPSCGLADAALCEGAVWMGTGADPRIGGQSEAWWTNDGGRSWTFGGDLLQEVDGPGYPLVAILAELDRAGQAAGGAGGAGRGIVVLGRGFVFRTLDGGASWERISRVADFNSSQIASSGAVGPDGRLYVGAPWNGTRRSPVLVTAEPAEAALSYVVSSGGAPERAELGVRVRPNPSAGGAVTVELSGDGAARASVVDAQGRVVAELFAGELRGGRTVELDTSAWAAGVYTVVVEAGGERTAEAFTVAR